MVNKVILIGRMGNDVIMRNTGNLAIANFLLATNSVVKGEKQVEWNTIVAFDKTAENLAKYCGKGSIIYVEGKIQHKTFDKKDGSKGNKTDIIAHTIQYIVSQKPNQSKQVEDTSDHKHPTSLDDDNIPF